MAEFVKALSGLIKVDLFRIVDRIVIWIIEPSYDPVKERKWKNERTNEEM